MKYPCDMIKDVLPLYQDDVCSGQTKKIVEEHLQECDACKGLMKKLGDNTYNDRLQAERETVISHYKRNVKKKTLLVGACVMGAILLTCLIANLATSRTLDWFFIVFSSLLVFASLVVPPLMAEKRKSLWTLCSFTASLMLLLLVCCLYSGGDWFGVASVSTLLGLSVVFLPAVAGQLPLTGLAARHKGLVVMAVDTALLYAVIIACGLYSSYVGYWQDALVITTVAALFPWALFGLIRYLRINALIKTGICFIVGGVFCSLIDDIITWVVDRVWQISFMNANLGIWSSDALINANVYLLVLLVGCSVGLVCIAVGLLHKRKG